MVLEMCSNDRRYAKHMCVLHVDLDVCKFMAPAVLQAVHHELCLLCVHDDVVDVDVEPYIVPGP